MNYTSLLAGLGLAAWLTSTASAQTQIADWNFDTLAAGNAGPLAADSGSGSATAVGLSSLTASTGNPGKSFSGYGWDVGDYYQFQVSTLGLQGISISFDQESSGTGPAQFVLQYSTDGQIFTQFGDVISLGSKATTWVSQSIDLSSVTAINNAAAVYFRVVDNSTTAINGSPVGTGGTSRIDNVVVTAASIVSQPGKPTIFTDIASTNVYAGRTFSLNVVANGTEPLTYHWYYPNLSTPLTDSGNLSGSATPTLTISGITTAQAGNYQVIIANSLGSITSSVASIVVKTPTVTDIAHLRAMEDTVNWVPTNTTDLFTVTGTVTTVVNVTGAGNAEFYIQDNTGGIVVFVAGGSYVPDAGTVVQVTGPLGQYHGLLELNLSASDPDETVTAVGSAPLPTPAQFNFSTAANIPQMEAIEGSLVVVSNVFLASASGYFTSGTVTLTNLSGQTFTMYINANQTDIIGQSVPAFAASITGVMGQYGSAAPYTSGYELDITQYGDLVAGTPPVIVPAIPLNIQAAGNAVTLTWTDPSFTLQAAPSATGTFTNVPNASSPYTETTDGAAKFYRLIH